MYDGLGIATAGANRPVLTNVALVISQPVLVMMVREVLNQCQEVEIRLTTHRVADLANLAGRELIHVVICEPLAAEEIRSMLHPSQRLAILARGDTSEARPGTVVLDLAGNSWPSALTALVRAPVAGLAARPERRLTETPVEHRQLVAWLRHQDVQSGAIQAEGLASEAACRSALSALPRLGRPTALLFLGLHRLVAHPTETDDLVQVLRATLRTEDAVFRIDALTAAMLIPTSDQRTVLSVVARLSWRLSPSNPSALAFGYALWQPGQAVDDAVNGAWSQLMDALWLDGR